MLRIILSLLCISAFSLAASAEVTLFDSYGFEQPLYNAGQSPVGQPASEPAIKRWFRDGGSAAGYLVQTSVVASGSQAIQANGGGLNDSTFLYQNLQYTPAANELVRFQVDLARTLTAGNVADSSPVYAVDILDFNFRRTSRFGLQQNGGVIRTFVSVPIDANGNIDPAGPNIRSEYYGPAIAENTFVHFDFLMDYVTKTVSLTVDGTRLASQVPFRTQASTNLDSPNFQIGTFNNVSADNGWFDNFVTSVLLKGDYNNNGTVDAADYVVWEKTLNSTSALAADGNGNGTVDAGDFDVWRANFGATQIPGSGSSSGLGTGEVPEPSCLVLMIAGLIAPCVARRRHSRVDQTLSHFVSLRSN